MLKEIKAHEHGRVYAFGALGAILFADYNAFKGMWEISASKGWHYHQWMFRPLSIFGIDIPFVGPDFFYAALSICFSALLALVCMFSSYINWNIAGIEALTKIGIDEAVEKRYRHEEMKYETLKELEKRPVEVNPVLLKDWYNRLDDICKEYIKHENKMRKELGKGATLFSITYYIGNFSGVASGVLLFVGLALMWFA